MSAGRTATKALAAYFGGAYDRIASGHESDVTRIVRLANNMYACGRLGRSGAARALGWLGWQMRRGTCTDFCFEANPQIFAMVDVLPEVFGDSMCVHIVRHPATYVDSAINFGTFRGLRWILATAVPYWTLKPERLDPDLGLRWSSMSEFQRAVWDWKTANSLINRAEEALPGRYLRLKYEELFDPKVRGLERMAEWLGLEPTPRLMELAAQGRINASPDRGYPPLEEWSESQQALLWEECGPLMKLYGYSL